MTTRTICLSAILMTLTAYSAMAGDLYTIRTSDRVLCHFNTQTLELTDIGPLGVPFDFGGLAYNPGTQTMYMVQGLSGSGLYTIDLSTGAATLVGSHGSERMFGLVCDRSSGKLYCGESTGSQGFHEIDPNTAELRLIATTRINMDGLTYDPIRQLIVAAWAGPGDLYSVDPIDGSTERIYNGGYFDNGGLAYDDDTGLYWLIDWGGNVFSYDPSNGYAHTLRLSGLGAHDGFAAAPRGANLYSLRISGDCPGPVSVSWDNATPNRQQGIVYGQDYGQTTIPNGACRGTVLGMSRNIRLVTTVGTGNGSGSVDGQAGRGACGGHLQLVEGGSCNTSNVAAIP